MGIYLFSRKQLFIMPLFALFFITAVCFSGCGILGPQEKECPLCNGTGKIVCSVCLGDGVIYRQLRYQVIDVYAEWVGLLIDTQRCQVVVRNTDDKAGVFIVHFTLGDPAATSKRSSSLISPGEVEYIYADFKVGTFSSGYVWSYQVEPERATFTCSQCGGYGRVTCPRCNGSGKIAD